MVTPSARSPERQAQDRRLAWLIVSGSAAVTLALATLVLVVIVRQIVREAAGADTARAAEAQREGGVRRAELAALAFKPLPPDTARPVGDPSRWPQRAWPPDVAVTPGMHGVVRVTLAIGADGVPTGCSVARSSGDAALDAATCRAMIWAGDFEPAKGHQRDTFRHWTSPPIDWDAVARRVPGARRTD